MTNYTFDERIVSDLYKESAGFRPSAQWWEAWNSFTDDQKQEEWDSLCDEHEQEMAREKQQQEKAFAKLQEKILDTINLGAASELEAIKWIIAAEEFDDYDLCYGKDYFCYYFGLAYSDAKKLPIQAAINELMVDI